MDAPFVRERVHRNGKMDPICTSIKNTAKKSYTACGKFVQNAILSMTDLRKYESVNLLLSSDSPTIIDSLVSIDGEMRVASLQISSLRP